VINPQLSDLMEVKDGLEDLVSHLFWVQFLASRCKVSEPSNWSCTLF